MPYTLEEAAALLRVSRATLRFWEEALRAELNVGRDVQGRLRFDDRHIQLIEQIRRWVLGERRCLTAVRRRLAAKANLVAEAHREQDRNGPGGGTAHSREETLLQPATSAAAPEKEMPIGALAEVESKPDSRGPDRSAGNALPPDSGTPESQQPDVLEGGDSEATDRGTNATGPEENRLEQLVTELAETVGYLVDENQALQDLVGRLVQYVESLGQAVGSLTSTNSTSGSAGANGHSTAPLVPPQHAGPEGSARSPSDAHELSPGVAEPAKNETRALPSGQAEPIAQPVERLIVPEGEKKRERIVRPWRPRKLELFEYGHMVHRVNRRMRK